MKTKKTKLQLARERNWRMRQIKGSCEILRYLAKQYQLQGAVSLINDIEGWLLTENDIEWNKFKSQLP